MKRQIHRTSAWLAFACVLTFWVSTCVSEVFLDHVAVVMVKRSIVYGLFVLIPAMALTAVSGIAMGKNRVEGEIARKKKRMPLIGFVGMVVLMPTALYLAYKSQRGEFDTFFYLIQSIEIAAGALQIAMLGMNVAAGLRLSGRRSIPR